MITARNCT